MVAISTNAGLIVYTMNTLLGWTTPQRFAIFIAFQGAGFIFHVCCIIIYIYLN
jgi:hypothetical protein